MAEVDLLKHFSDLASATHRIGIVLEETYKIMHEKDKHNFHLHTLGDAVKAVFVAGAELDRLIFDLMLDAEDDKRRR